MNRVSFETEELSFEVAGEQENDNIVSEPRGGRRMSVASD